MDDSRKTLESVYRMIQYSVSMGTSLDRNAILEKTLTISKEITSAEAASLLLMNEKKTRLEFQVALGEVGNKVKEQPSIPLGHGIAGWVAEQEEPILIDDAYQDARFCADYDMATGFRTKSILAIPLRKNGSKGEIIGVAMVFNKIGQKTFTRSDLEVFHAFGMLVAAAIESARAHQFLLEKESLQRELTYAQKIQQSFLPHSFPELEKINFFAFHKFANMVGGDFYSLFPIHENNFCMAIGDVSGKGIYAAIYMAKAINELMHQARICPSPAEVLKKMNQSFYAQDLTELFVTCSVAFIDIQKEKIQIANAGHLPSLLILPEEENEGRKTKNQAPASGPPLGVIETSFYEDVSVEIPSGASFLMYTDGISEAKNEKKELFGEDRILKMCQSLPNDSSKIPDFFKEHIHAFVGQTPQFDDMTLIGFHKS